MSRTKLILAATALTVGLAGCSRARKDQGEPTKQEAPAPQATQPGVAIQPEQPAAAGAPTKAAAVPAHAKRAVRPKPAATNQRTVMADTNAVAPPAPHAAMPPPAPPVENPALDRPAPPAAPPRPTTAVAPAGSRFDVRLSDMLSSAHNRAGETFQATLDRDLEVGGAVVAPRGSTVVGKLVSVVESGRVEGLARMSLTLTGIRVEGKDYPIETNTLAFDAPNTKKQDAAKVGGGAGLGAIIGAIAGGGKGAAIGAAVGGAAGTATVLGTRGKPVELKPEETLTFRLENAVTLPIARQSRE